jgi:hypothetical protein
LKPQVGHQVIEPERPPRTLIRRTTLRINKIGVIQKHEPPTQEKRKKATGLFSDVPLLLSSKWWNYGEVAKTP